MKARSRGVLGRGIVGAESKWEDIIKELTGAAEISAFRFRGPVVAIMSRYEIASC